MKWIRLLLAISLLFAGGCDQKPEKVYHPPTLSGVAYVLGEANHLAVMDLATFALSRLKLDRPVADIAVTGGKLYLLAKDGSLLTMDPSNGKTTVLGRPLTDGIGMTLAPDGSLWLLSSTALCHWQPPATLVKRLALPTPASSLFFDAAHGLLVLVNRKSSSLAVFDPSTRKVEKRFAPIGNSVHSGASFPGQQEYWIAEGNEYRNGKPYGVGYIKKGPAMPGGINVIDAVSGKQTDFIMLGGNVEDVVFGPAGKKAYLAVSQLPAYIEASLVVVDTAQRRELAEIRVCDRCHEQEGINIGRSRLLVRSLAIDWTKGQKITGKEEKQ